MKQDDSSKTVKIGSNLNQGLKDELIQCLRSHADVFARSHVDMPGIDPKIACHKLAIQKGATPVKQKRGCFKQERYKAINIEVEKLLRVY